MIDYKEGIKKEVAEIKFLIHDLRVERFINEIIHFHVTLNTDLEIYSIEQAQILHGQDLQVLKTKAVSLRKAYQDYSNAVKSFSPDHTILMLGKNYVETIRGTCALILNPLWGRIDKVIDFLPPDSRSVLNRDHYRNCIHWIAGVSRRIEHFLDEQHQKIHEEFDLGAELEEFTHNVIHHYVSEKSGGAVRLVLETLDSAIIGGNPYRLRRMYFNLVMNAVDAMADRKEGILAIGDTLEGDRVVLRVRDDGVGMTPEKIQQLLTDKETLDGELDSLGFVFVRQTIAEFKGELAIDSKLGEGTTVTVSFPLLPGKPAESRTSRRPAKGAEPGQRDRMAREAPQKPPHTGGLPRSPGAAAPARRAAPSPAAKPAPPAGDRNNACGQLIYDDYQNSQARFPGSIFAISVTEAGVIDFFTHKPYDRYWNMDHEDLAPMTFEATVRGRLEEDDRKRPLLTLKEPQSVKEYFDFKNVPASERSAERHLRMVHDEYIRIARRLIDTGLSPEMPVELAGLPKFFPGREDLGRAEPFPLRLLAEQPLTTESGE